MNWSLILTILYALLIIAICFKILLDTSSSDKAAAYILLIITLPIFGIIIYIVFGLNYRKSTIYSKKLLNDKAQSDALIQTLSDLKKEKDDQFNVNFGKYESLANMLFKENLSILTDKNEAEILVNGEKKFPKLIRALKAAKSHIHMEYYIYENDDLGNEIAEVLIQKAQEGVKVRFIYDAFGSRNIRKNIVKRMEKAGIEAYPFYKIIFVHLANRINYRNHRKIVVIDGETGFVGGINVANTYRNNSKNSFYWRDTHIKIKGKAVWTLQHIFLADWNFCSEQHLGIDTDFFRNFAHNEPTNELWVQTVSSGPDSPYPSILHTYLQLVHTAKERFYITTPYFIPGKELTEALKIAALRGVEVKLLVPKKGDSIMVNSASKSNYQELLKAGVEVYLYKKGFIHAKTLVCDDRVSLIGTANFDQRSFNLNFEVNTIMYDFKKNKELASIFNEDLKDAEQLNYDEWSNRPLPVLLFEKFVNLFSPIM